MGCSTTNIHFDYKGTYSKTEDDYELTPSDGRLKMVIDPCKKRLNLSYIPLVVKPKRQSYILDNEDVRNILYVECSTKLEIIGIKDNLLRTEKAISYCGNYSELSNGLPKVEANHVAVSLYIAIEEA
ncbi:hypothetical protein N665_0430s0002 [Sinapis alba]|nr:hypothetical protein N665_0430s0002 [Sinapis alba]